MRISKFIGYGLFCFSFLSGLAALIYLLTSHKAAHRDVLTLTQTPKVLVIDSSHHAYVVTCEAVDLISIKKPYLILGADSLEYQTGSLSGRPLYVPVKPAVWQNYWAGVLGTSVPGREDQRWQIAQQKWRTFVQDELDSLRRQSGLNSLRPENQLCHALLQKILSSPAQTFYVRNKSLESISTPKTWSTPAGPALPIQPSVRGGDESPNLSWLLTIVLIATGMAGIIYTRMINTLTNQSENLALEKTSEEAGRKTGQPTVQVQPEPDQEAEATRHYVQHFVNRYGDLYQMLENMPEPIPDERTKMAVKRQLVEMALHAQSFMRAYLLAKMQRPQGEPNLLLITSDWKVTQLDPQTYQTFTSDPYKTNKRYRLLQQILAEMNIGQLEGALMHDIYLPAEFLT